MRVEEVVGDFVNLKRRGANYLGLCPFHQEKTPSFTVTASKGIFKCFGCGKGGNALNFIMEHENCSYPEAIKWIANKYHIEIEEDFDKTVDEAKAEQKERESLHIALQYAGDWFAKALLETEEGQNIGLSYLEERGYRRDTIIKFGLGYCPDSWTLFYQSAIKAGYQVDYLEKAGLIKSRETGGDYFDFFKGRVMFPIHALSGKIIGFGGRVLQKDAKTAKYLNSPESEVYHKSEVLYGIYQAKKAITQQDNCLLVEGYTDVITLHQAGIEHAVASSGTSLTPGQIKLIRRFTDHVTVLYDGDFAGIKASLRGVDLLLQGGLNVKVVTFPEGEDPDSYCKKVGGDQFGQYIDTNKQDFINFKSAILLKGSETDPVKRAEVMRLVAESVAGIPDHFKREVYIQECERQFGFSADLFSREVAAIRKRTKEKEVPQEAYSPEGKPEPLTYVKPIVPAFIAAEEDLVRVVMEFGHLPASDGVSVLAYLLQDLEHSGIRMEDSRVAAAWGVLQHAGFQEDYEHFLLQHPLPEVSALAVDILTRRPPLSPHWQERYEVEIKPRQHIYISDMYQALNRLKIIKVDQELSLVRAEMTQPELTLEQLEEIMTVMRFWMEKRNELCMNTGTVVLK